MKTILIIGATSGIGLGLTKKYLATGNNVIATGRNLTEIENLKGKYPNTLKIYKYDLLSDDPFKMVSEWFRDFDGIDVCILNSGIATDNKMTNWTNAQVTIQTNIIGHSKIMFALIDYARKTKCVMTLAMITSVAGLRGLRQVPLYSASKAFQINLLQAVRGLVQNEKLPLKVVDIRPGFVDTRMAGGTFWMASVECASKQIIRAIEKKKRVAYVSKRWIIIGLLLKTIPNFIHERF